MNNDRGRRVSVGFGDLSGFNKENVPIAEENPQTKVRFNFKPAEQQQSPRLSTINEEIEQISSMRKLHPDQKKKISLYPNSLFSEEKFKSDIKQKSLAYQSSIKKKPPPQSSHQIEIINTIIQTPSKTYDQEIQQRLTQVGLLIQEQSKHYSDNNTAIEQKLINIREELKASIAQFKKKINENPTPPKQNNSQPAVQQPFITENIITQLESYQIRSNLVKMMGFKLVKIKRSNNLFHLQFYYPKLQLDYFLIISTDLVNDSQQQDPQQCFQTLMQAIIRKKTTIQDLSIQSIWSNYLKKDEIIEYQLKCVYLNKNAINTSNSLNILPSLVQKFHKIENDILQATKEWGCLCEQNFKFFTLDIYYGHRFFLEDYSEQIKQGSLDMLKGKVIFKISISMQNFLIKIHQSSNLAETFKNLLSYSQYKNNIDEEDEQDEYQNKEVKKEYVCQQETTLLVLLEELAMKQF